MILTLTDSCSGGSDVLGGVERTSTAVDRALTRRRRRRFEPSHSDDSNQQRLIGLGSVVLGRLRGECKSEALEAFRLYAGLGESGEILIQRREFVENHEKSITSFYLTEDVELICKHAKVTSDGTVVQKIELDSPEDFLRINSEAVEAIYGDLMKEGFWDRVAFKHSHQGKPGYENVWSERTQTNRF